MSHGSHRNGSPVAVTDGGEDAVAAEAKGEGISNGGLFENGGGGGGGGGVGVLSSGSILSLFDSGPGDTVMLSAVELSSSLWKLNSLS